MGRRIRNTDPAKYHSICIKTEGDRLRLTPTREVNEIVGGVVAKYQNTFEVLIYAYVFMGNHYHLLVRAPLGNLWLFELAINREIARRVNYLHRCKGHFWKRRYVDLIVVDESELLQGLLYIVGNPVHHGLVKHPRDWPGVSCYNQLITGNSVSFPFVHYSEYSRAKRYDPNVSIKDYTEYNLLKLTSLPECENMSIAERQEWFKQTIDEWTRQKVAERIQDGKSGFLGKHKLRRQRPFSVPKQVKNSPEPACYSHNPATIMKYTIEYAERYADYSIASRELRSGRFDAVFPPYCLKPPLHFSVR